MKRGFKRAVSVAADYGRLVKGRTRLSPHSTRRIISVTILLGFSLALIPGVPNLGTKKASAGQILARDGQSATSNSANNLSANKPTGTVTGDVLVAAVAAQGSGRTFTANTGTWTAIATTNSNAASIGTFYRVVDSSDTARSTYNFGVSATTAIVVSIVTYTGVDTGTVLDQTTTTNTGTSSTSVVASGITTVTGRARLVGVFAVQNTSSGNSTFTPPTGMFERTDAKTTTTTNVSMEIADVIQNSAGASGNKTATATTAGVNAAHLIALRPDSTIHVMLFWDGNGAAPTGWTYVTDAEGFYLRGESPANYDVTGGHSIHTHDNPNSVTVSGPSQIFGGLFNSASSANHTHTPPSSTVSSTASNEPAGYKLRLIRYDGGVPNVIPNGGIAIFDGDPGMPTDGHWSRLTAADSRVIKIDSSVGNGPGSDTHTHTLSWGTLGSSASNQTAAACNIVFFGCVSPDNNSAAAVHTHSIPATSASTIATQIPPYFQPVLGKVDQDTPTISLGITALFDGDPGGGWVIRSSSGGDYYRRFIRPGASFAQSGTPSDLCSGGFGCVGHKIPDSTVVTGPPTGSAVDGHSLTGITAGAAHTHTITATWPAYTSDSHYIADNEYFLPLYFDVVIAEKVNFILFDYYWYENNGLLTPTNKWGNPDLAHQTAIATLPISSMNPPIPGTELRLRIQIKINGNNLAVNSVNFKLQYLATKTSLCTAPIGTWTDVGAPSSGTEWEYGTSSLTDGATLWTTPNASVFSPQSTIAEQYVKSATSPTKNPNGATIGNTVEYDFHIKNISAAPATQYSFRVLENTGTLLSEYDVCPTLTTRPSTENQLRHGNFFESDPNPDTNDLTIYNNPNSTSQNLEKGFSWAD